MISQQDFETNIKILVVGNGGVGKSSLLNRFCKSAWTVNHRKTIGTNYYEKTLNAPDGTDIVMSIWDTAGQEDYNPVCKKYYDKSDACILAFSTIDRGSLNAIKKWKKLVEESCPGILFILVENKIDLASVFNRDEIESVAEELHVQLHRVSVKDNLNVQNSFETLAKYLYQKKNAQINVIDQDTLPFNSIAVTNAFEDEADDISMQGQIPSPHFSEAESVSASEKLQTPDFISVDRKKKRSMRHRKKENDDEDQKCIVM